MPPPSPFRATLRKAVIAAAFGFWGLIACGLLVYAVRVAMPRGGHAREVQVLAKAVSPDGFLEARLLRIVGGPAMGGATDWQEVALARRGTPVRFLKAEDDPGFVFAVPGEATTPVARLWWRSPTNLVVAGSRPEGGAPRRWQVLGVRIEEADPSN